MNFGILGGQALAPERSFNSRPSMLNDIIARSCIMDNGDIVCAGYVGNGQSGFVFVADEGVPAVWRISSSGDLLTETFLEVEGMGQVAKIRKDISSGFVVCSTAWGFIDDEDTNVAALVKLSDNFDMEWSQVGGTLVNLNFI